ncbi:hypothetical protein ALQ79_200574 [Pseudomonas amygdali pv. lachrymans]|nr:hypothetical protein ALQ79_200574 [Pseudomonas amygdali pv. lachrymans]
MPTAYGTQAEGPKFSANLVPVKHLRAVGTNPTDGKF